MRRLAASSAPPAAKSSNDALGHPDDVVGDERRALARAVLGVLQAALPLQDRPAVVVVGGEPREDADEVDLAVAQRAEPPGALEPGLEARIDALLRARVELGVLDVERPDPLVVDVDEAEIVELLQEEVAGIVVDVAARMVADPLEEHLEGHAVDQVLARMELVADVDAGLIERIQDRLPAPRQLVERGLDQAGRPRRPGIEIGPGERAREADVGGEAEPPRGLGGQPHLLDRPFLPGLGIAAHLRVLRRRRRPRRRPGGPRPAGPADGSRARSARRLRPRACP